MPTTDTSVVQVGIAGLGRAGWTHHFLTFEEMPAEYKVVAACDAQPDRLQEAHSRAGCTPYTDYAAMLTDEAVQLVVIALPSHLHADLAIQAMNAGKDVIIEKPFATNLKDVDRMIEVANATGRVLTGSQNLRYTPDFLKVREVIASGKLGRVIMIRMAWHWFRRRWDWQTLKEFGGGSLNNDGSHVVDQALLLFGDAEPSVFCHMEATPLSMGDAEDHVKIILQAPSSPLIDMEFSNAVAFPLEKWSVMGTQGGLTGSFTELHWKFIDPAALEPRQLLRQPTPGRSYNREQLPWQEESASFPDEHHNDSNKRLYHDLYRTLRERAPLAVTAASIRRQISVLEQCRAQSPLYNEQVRANAS